MGRAMRIGFTMCCGAILPVVWVAALIVAVVARWNGDDALFRLSFTAFVYAIFSLGRVSLLDVWFSHLSLREKTRLTLTFTYDLHPLGNATFFLLSGGAAGLPGYRRKSRK